MIPILLFSSPSKSGKTQFISHVIPVLLKYGLNVGYIKHHHGSYYDNKIKDTGKMIQAGVSRTLLLADDVLVLEEPSSRDNDYGNELDVYVERYFKDCQLVIVEGFKEDRDHPKIILWRGDLEENRGWIEKRMSDKNIIAMVSDESLPVPYPIFKRHDYVKFCKFVLEYFHIDAGKQ